MHDALCLEVLGFLEDLPARFERAGSPVGEVQHDDDPDDEPQITVIGAMLKGNTGKGFTL